MTTYMYHCHLLEHKDHEMMHLFVVLPQEILNIMEHMRDCHNIHMHMEHMQNNIKEDYSSNIYFYLMYDQNCESIIGREFISAVSVTPVEHKLQQQIPEIFLFWLFYLQF